MDPLTLWVFVAALRFAPYDATDNLTGETRWEALHRYAEIARDITEAAREVDTHLGDRSEAALLLALAIGETHLAPDTDGRPCVLERDARRCDGNTSATIWQLKPKELDGRRLSLADLRADRALAARVALRFAAGSLSACRKLPAQDRLSGYGAGRCWIGLEGVRREWRLWGRIALWEPR